MRKDFSPVSHSLLDNVTIRSKLFNTYAQISPLQALHGPVELLMPQHGRDIAFRTSGKNNRGCVVMLLYTASGEKSSIEIPFVHIESFAMLTSGNKPAISMILSDFAAKNLALRLGTRDKIEHIMRGYPNGLEEGSKKLVFVLQPYKDSLFVQYSGSENNHFGGINELHKRIDVWVRFIRNRDLLAKEQRQQANRSCQSHLEKRTSEDFLGQYS
ncbi:unnamed protein product [Strongylus vulgaris]|uniref:Uncharacterized protein n=1 Tax=Strongylus vulgaris TaxID=40348 RepID=A0A3P7IT26_STRVU|nr:unnamed protein product [Strongylus vulgaris]